MNHFRYHIYVSGVEGSEAALVTNEAGQAQDFLFGQDHDGADVEVTISAEGPDAYTLLQSVETHTEVDLDEIAG